jgi:hypothetical protein
LIIEIRTGSPDPRQHPFRSRGISPYSAGYGDRARATGNKGIIARLEKIGADPLRWSVRDWPDHEPGRIDNRQPHRDPPDSQRPGRERIPHPAQREERSDTADHPILRLMALRRSGRVGNPFG